MIYFDNAATTRPSLAVLECFEKENEQCFANPSSRHAYGREAYRKLENARLSILKSLSLSNDYRVLFTSGASESNNLAIKGIAKEYLRRGKRIITTQVEHPSVLEAFRSLEKEGFEVIYLPTKEDGTVDPETLKENMNKETILVSIMATNNETGSNNDILALSKIVHTFPKAFFHVDVTQAIGKRDLPYSSIDLFSFSGHKIHGLKGTGALILKKNITLLRQIDGGDQEYFFRAGTDNLPGDETLAVALEEATKNLQDNIAHAKEISSFLREGLEKNDEILMNSPLEGSPFILNFSLKRKKASVVTEALSHEGIYVSSVSACNSKGEPVSYVLEAMGFSKERAMNSIRLSFSRENTLEEAKTFLNTLQNILERTINR